METYENQENQSRKDHTTQDNQYQSNTDELERNWKHMRHSYRQKYPSLTEEDVNYRSGEFDNMTERIAQRTNRTRQDVAMDIRNWNDEEE